MFRSTAGKLTLVASLVSLTASAAPPPSPAPAPSTPRVMPTSLRPTAPQPAELRIVNATLAGTQPLQPGGAATVNVEIENTSAVSAQVAAAFGPRLPRQAVVRGSTVNVAPRSRVTTTVSVPLDPRGIERERFSAYLFLADPAKPASGNALEQLWRDGNINDNTRTLVLSVPVNMYDVTVTMSQVNVENDCNPGDAKSNWRLEYRAGSIDAAHAGVFLRDRLVASYVGPPETNWWPAPDRYQLVSTGDRLTARIPVRLPNVSKARHLAVTVHGRINNGIWYDQNGSLPRLVATIPPEDWNYGGTRQYAARAHERSHGNCGPTGYSIVFTIQTTPTVLK